MLRFPGYGRLLSLNVRPALAATLRLLLRLARVPFVLPFLTFCILFWIAESSWCTLYDYDNLWKPAFPYSWIVWVLALVVAPLTAALWLGAALGWSTLRWSVNYIAWRRLVRLNQNGNPIPRADEEEEYMLLSDSESGDAGHVRRPSSPTLSFGTRRCVRLSAVWWWVQMGVFAFIALLGTWEATHYAHPHDVRFKHVVEQAGHNDVRPEGYGKQGE